MPERLEIPTAKEIVDLSITKKSSPNSSAVPLIEENGSILLPDMIQMFNLEKTERKNN